MNEISPVIDIHCHAAGTGAGNSGCFVSPRSPGKLALPGVPQGLWRHRAGIGVRGGRAGHTTYLTASGPVAAGGSGGDFGHGRAWWEITANWTGTATEVYIPNEFVARETAKYPNLLFGTSVNPYRSDALERLEQAAVDGAVLLKWLPSVQNIDPADKRSDPLLSTVEGVGVAASDPYRQRGILYLSAQRVGRPGAAATAAIAGGYRYRGPLRVQRRKRRREQFSAVPPVVRRISQSLRRYLGVDPGQPHRASQQGAPPGGPPYPAGSWHRLAAAGYGDNFSLVSRPPAVPP